MTRPKYIYKTGVLLSGGLEVRVTKVYRVERDGAAIGPQDTGNYHACIMAQEGGHILQSVAGGVNSSDSLATLTAAVMNDYLRDHDEWRQVQ